MSALPPWASALPPPCQPVGSVLPPPRLQAWSAPPPPGHWGRARHQHPVCGVGACSRGSRWGVAIEANVQGHALCGERYSACCTAATAVQMDVLHLDGLRHLAQAHLVLGSTNGSSGRPPSTLLNPATPLVHRRRGVKRTCLGCGAAGGRKGCLLFQLRPSAQNARCSSHQRTILRPFFLGFSS